MPLGVPMESALYDIPVECTRPPDVCSHRRFVPLLCTLWEIFLVLFSSVITTSYTLHHERRVGGHASSELQSQAFNPGHFGFFLDPSPGLMLGSCVLLGCSVSSFAYRRQERDRFQAPIFALAICVASALGVALSINANLLMLGLFPWALCCAMVLSSAAHWLLRRCSGRRAYNDCDLGEKDLLLGH